MIRDIIDTVTAFLSAFTYARKYNLFPYLWLSGLISLIVGGTLFLVAYGLSDNIGGLLVSWWPWEWGRGIIDTVSGIFSGLILAITGLFLYKYIVMILISPIMSPLSERLEEGIRGESDGEKLSVTRLLKEIVRGIRISLRNLIREMFYTILLLLVSLVPSVAIMSTPSLYLIQSYYLGFGSMDYYLERHYNVKESIQFVGHNKWVAVTIGGLFILILLIPLAGLFLAPFLCSITATIMCIERDNR